LGNIVEAGEGVLDVLTVEDGALRRAGTEGEGVGVDDGGGGVELKEGTKEVLARLETGAEVVVDGHLDEDKIEFGAAERGVRREGVDKGGKEAKERRN
jgi:hypothetical protein